MRRIVTGLNVCLLLVGLMVAAGDLSAAPSAEREQIFRTYVTQPDVSPMPQELTMQQRVLIAIPLVYGGVSRQEFLAEVPPLLSQSYRLTTYLLASDTSYTWVDPDWVNNYRNSYAYSGTRQTSWISQYWDTDSLNWLNVFDLYYWYDGSARLTSNLFRTWQNGAWLNADSTTYTYDGSGNLDVSITRIWATNQWVNNLRTTNPYSGGKISQSLTDQWQGGAWVEYSRMTYMYDGSGNMTVFLMELKQGTSWVGSTRYKYYYDAQNREIESTTETWQTSDFELLSRTTSSYDVSGNPSVDVLYYWVAAVWETIEADTFKYSGSQLTQEVRWQILTNTLVRNDYTYDGNGNMILDLRYVNSFGLGWEPLSRDVFVYEAQPSWIRGDVIASGAVNIADVVYLVAFIFNGGPPPQPSMEVGDANCSGQVNLADAVYIVQYIFNGGPAPCPQ